MMLDEQKSQDTEVVHPVRTAQSMVDEGEKSSRGSPGPYRKYTDKQRAQLFELVIEQGMTAAAAEHITGINKRTAHRYVQLYRQDPEMRLPGAQRKNAAGRGNQKLFEERSAFLIAFYKKDAAATLHETRDALCQQFAGLTITLSGLQKHLVRKCCPTMKKLEKLPAARVSERVINLRYNVVSSWLADGTFNYSESVFIDEAGFNMHLKRNFGRSARGKPAKAVVPSQRGVNITILGAISKDGVIDLTLRKPEAEASRKRRRQNSGKSETLNARLGTRTEHYIAFISNVMDTLDKHGMKGKRLIMDNAPIHTNQAIRELIEGLGYECVYLPLFAVSKSHRGILVEGESRCQKK